MLNYVLEVCFIIRTTFQILQFSRHSHEVWHINCAVYLQSLHKSYIPVTELNWRKIQDSSILATKYGSLSDNTQYFYECVTPSHSHSWEDRSVRREIPYLLSNPKFYYHVHKSPPLVPILSQINLVHTLTPYLLKIHFNILHLFPDLQSGLFPSHFPTKPLLKPECPWLYSEESISGLQSDPN
jgi:hypothetical protein